MREPVKRLKYFTELLAMKATGGDISRIARIASRYKEVINTQLRSHDYNLWVSIKSGSRKKAKAVLSDIKTRIGLKDCRSLPQLEEFKEMNDEETTKCKSCLITWNVPIRTVHEIGAQVSNLPEISWCCLRPKLSDFPYNLYTIVNGSTREDIISKARKIAKEIGINHHKMLWTEREFNNVSTIQTS